LLEIYFILHKGIIMKIIRHLLFLAICFSHAFAGLDFDPKSLIEQALSARENSFSPYSKFKVGAAVLTNSGKVYTGTNVENASYGLTICAERVAIFKAVSEGEKGNFIKAIAIVLDAPEYGAPCGACRQVINEFAEPDVHVVMATVSGKYKIEQLKTLLPYAFKLEQK
jgi:cytidine deaminase